MKQSLIKLVVVFGVVMTGFLAVFFASSAQAQSAQPPAGQRLITIHDDGLDRGILTQATTLRQAFAEAHLPIDPSDLVEPGLDETLVATHYEVNVYRARPVTVVDGAIRQKVLSPYQTAKQIVEHAGMVLHDEDTTSLSANTDMVSEGAGLQLTITRATPFILDLYGTKTQAYTQAKTVGEMLKQKNITLAADDTLSVTQTAPMQVDMTIELWRNGKQTATEQQDIPFDTQKIQDADQPVGYKQVKTPGVVGKKIVTFEIEMKNGQEVSRREIQSVVTQQPAPQVEVVGAKMANTFSGSFGEALAQLRGCEAGGTYSRNSGNGYYGAYQYNISTWAGYGGYTLPSDAPPAVQDEKAWSTYQGRGWQPWPSCSVKLGLQDIYR